MKIEDLIHDMRTTLVDWGPYGPTVNNWKTDDADMLWSNVELADYLRRAEDEYCRRYPIRDNTTVEICQATVTAASDYFVVDPRVLEITHVRLSTGTKPLRRITVDELDEVLPETWETENGEPTSYILEDHSLRVRLYPIPTVSGTAALRVGRKPINNINWKFPHREPEIPERHHPLLVDWALHLAYQKDDTEETFDVKRAGMFRDIFNSNVGGDISVKAEEARRQLSGTRVHRTRAYYR